MYDVPQVHLRSTAGNIQPSSLGRNFPMCLIRESHAPLRKAESDVLTTHYRKHNPFRDRYVFEDSVEYTASRWTVSCFLKVSRNLIPICVPHFAHGKTSRAAKINRLDRRLTD